MNTPAPTIRLTFSAVACHTPNCRRRAPPSAPTPDLPRLVIMARLATHDRTHGGPAMLAPRAILFDLGGTLLRQASFRPEAWLEALPGIDPVGTQPLLRQLIR